MVELSVAPVEAETAPPRPVRNRDIEGLRAIAALMVVMTHVAVNSTGNRGTWGLWWSRMDAGVTVFFVISGYLLYRPFARALLQDRARPGLPALRPPPDPAHRPCVLGRRPGVVPPGPRGQRRRRGRRGEAGPVDHLPVRDVHAGVLEGQPLGAVPPGLEPGHRAVLLPLPPAVRLGARPPPGPRPRRPAPPAVDRAGLARRRGHAVPPVHRAHPVGLRRRRGARRLHADEGVAAEPPRRLRPRHGARAPVGAARRARSARRGGPDPRALDAPPGRRHVLVARGLRVPGDRHAGPGSGHDRDHLHARAGVHPPVDLRGHRRVPRRAGGVRGRPARCRPHVPVDSGRWCSSARSPTASTCGTSS